MEIQTWTAKSTCIFEEEVSCMCSIFNLGTIRSPEAFPASLSNKSTRCFQDMRPLFCWWSYFYYCNYMSWSTHPKLSISKCPVFSIDEEDLWKRKDPSLQEHGYCWLYGSHQTCATGWVDNWLMPHQMLLPKPYNCCNNLWLWSRCKCQ